MKRVKILYVDVSRRTTEIIEIRREQRTAVSDRTNSEHSFRYVDDGYRFPLSLFFNRGRYFTSLDESARRRRFLDVDTRSVSKLIHPRLDKYAVT